MIDYFLNQLGYTKSAAAASPPAPDLDAVDLLRQVTASDPSQPAPARRRLSRRSVGFAAASTSRLWADWPTSRISRDSQLQRQLLPIRARARQLADDDEYGGGFLRLLTTNVVGPTGIRLSMGIVDERDPKGVLPDQFANDAIEAAYRDFSLPDNYTTTRKLSRVDTENLLIKTLARDGEFLARQVYGYKRNKYRFAVQPIEVDYLDEEKWDLLPGGAQIKMGVQFDSWRSPSHYWLRTHNPGDLMRSTGPRRSEPFPARDASDRPLILHKFIPDYIEQSRGVSWFHNALTRLKMLGGWEIATLEAARAAACKHEYFSQDAESGQDYVGDGTDDDGNFLNENSPGSKEILPLGWSVQHIDPAFPTSEHGSFNKSILRGVSSGLGVSYNSLAKDLEGVNFSSIRAGLLEDRDVWKAIQAWIICNYSIPTFNAWLEMSLLSGAIRLPNGSPLPARKFLQFNKPMFAGRRWQWVDPMKEVGAGIAGLESQVTTRQRMLDDSNGGDLEDIFRDTEKEKLLAAKYGLTLTTPKTVVIVGADMADPQAGDAPTKTPPADD